MQPRFLGRLRTTATVTHQVAHEVPWEAHSRNSSESAEDSSPVAIATALSSAAASDDGYSVQRLSLRYRQSPLLITLPQSLTKGDGANTLEGEVVY